MAFVVLAVHCNLYVECYCHPTVPIYLRRGLLLPTYKISAKIIDVNGQTITLAFHKVVQQQY